MKENMLLLTILLMIFTTSCTTIKYIEVYPSLPEVPEIKHPGNVISNNDESDELEVIINQKNTIQDLKLWIDTLLKRMNKPE